MLDLEARFSGVASLIAGARDLLLSRPRDGTPPEPVAARGWAPFLEAMTDDALDALESRGLAAEWPEGAPSSLRALIEEARTVTAMPGLHEGAVEPRRLRVRESARKQLQVDAFTAVVAPLAARSERVVDVGAGHGHLTRAVAERLNRPVLGLERDEQLAARARTLGDEGATFAVTDVLRDGLPLRAGDCVIGLHACGELGDEMVVQAAACGASIALVGCCLQKRRQTVRRSLSREAGGNDALDLPRATPGLSNLTARDVGVETTRAENLAARARRLALRHLLEEDGAPLRPGAEIDGLNRRVAQGDLPTLVQRAFSARGRPAPHAGAIAAADAWAAVHHARMRRFALPRSMLARALEVFVLLDRARYLESRGYRVTVGELFSPSVSARNLVLVARLSDTPA